MSIPAFTNRVDARSLFAAFRRNTLISLAIFFVCLGAGVVAVEVATPKYTSVVQLFVSAQDSGVGSNLQGVYEGGLFTQQRVQSYVDIVSNTTVTAPVVRQLALPFTAKELSARISASVPTNSVLINVSILDTSPSRAQRIANAVANQFIAFTSGLESRHPASSPVKVSVSQPASLPTSPTSPRKSLDIGLAVLLGIFLMVAFCAVRVVTDTAIRTAQRLTELTGAAVLATIPFDREARKSPVAPRRAGGPRAEAYRQLRTNLQFLNVDRPPRSLVVTSPHAGDGKTSTALNLASVCADAGMGVAVVDADLRRPQVKEMLGVREQGGLTVLLREHVPARTRMQPSPAQPAFDVLVSGPTPPNPSELLGSDRMRQIVGELRGEYDLVLFDAPPLLPVTDAAILAALCDGVILVVRHSASKISDLRRSVTSLERVSATLLGTILNAVPVSSSDRYGAYYSYASSDSEHHGDDPQALAEDPDREPARLE